LTEVKGTETKAEAKGSEAKLETKVEMKLEANVKG
jgi:hypothetical protein